VVLFRSEWGCAHKLSEEAKSKLGDIQNVKRLWLGKDNAYIGERNNGSLSWNLAGHYSGLAEKMLAVDVKIKVCVTIACFDDLCGKS
jgi:hypothetical protein